MKLCSLHLYLSHTHTGMNMISASNIHLKVKQFNPKLRLSLANVINHLNLLLSSNFCLRLPFLPKPNIVCDHPLSLKSTPVNFTLTFFHCYIYTHTAPPISQILSLSPNNCHYDLTINLPDMCFLQDREKKPRFCINDHVDLLIEILKRLDGRSLCTAACVCRLWCTIARNDSLWEELCFRHVTPPPSSGVRPVVVALGGYKRLYMVCVRPVLSRLGGGGGCRRVGDSSRIRRVWTRDELQLSLSLFCVDYYERLGRLGNGDASPSSLMFLCKPVNV